MNEKSEDKTSGGDDVYIEPYMEFEERFRMTAEFQGLSEFTISTSSSHSSFFAVASINLK